MSVGDFRNRAVGCRLRHRLSMTLRAANVSNLHMPIDQAFGEVLDEQPDRGVGPDDGEIGSGRS